MKAPKGTLCVLELINEQIVIKRENNRIPIHKLIGNCGLSSAEIETVLDYLISRGFISLAQKTSDFGGLVLQINGFKGIEGYKNLLKFERRTNFNPETGILKFLEYDIYFGMPGKNLMSDLLRTLFSSPNKEWSNDEIYDDWQYIRPDRIKAVNSKQTYQAGIKINAEIQKISGIAGFLAVSTKSIKINPDFLT